MVRTQVRIEGSSGPGVRAGSRLCPVGGCGEYVQRTDRASRHQLLGVNLSVSFDDRPHGLIPRHPADGETVVKSMGAELLEHELFQTVGVQRAHLSIWPLVLLRGDHASGFLQRDL